METKAKLRHLRTPPRKARLIADAIRGLPVERALEVMKFSSKRAALPMTKLINSSIANAKHNHQIEKDNLYISEIRVDEGPTLKRWRARAFGRASGIKKRTSHISIILSEIKESKTPEKKDKKGVAKTGSKSDQKKDSDVKVVKSLDEVKEKAEDHDHDHDHDKDKSQVEKTKQPGSGKRRFFNRKSG
jgi:large subunit ribosomal protein L22